MGETAVPRAGGRAGGERRRGREAALQMLYQWEIGGGAPENVIRDYWLIEPEEGPPRPETLVTFANALFSGTAREIGVLDPRIEQAAEHWRLARMATIDRLVLRLAVFELLEGDNPPAVVINEALELARTYSGDDAVGFVNGVLDAIRRRIEEEAAR